MPLHYPQELSGNSTSVRPAIGQQLAFTFFDRPNLLGETIDKLKKVIGGGNANADSIITELQNIKTQLTVAETIRLYVPHQIRNTLAATYEDVSMVWAELGFDMINDIMNAAGKASNGASIKDALGGLSDAKYGSLLAFAPDILSKFAPSASGATDSLLAGTKKALGVVGNPMITTLFKNMALRTFNFTYLFSPRNKSEAEQVEQIINYFKESTLPTVSNAQRYALGFPREVRVTSFSSQEGAEAGDSQIRDNDRNFSVDSSNINKFLFRTKNCVITDFDLNYTPAGQHNVFSGAGTEKFAGMPTQIEMNVVLRETEILTREDVQKHEAY